MQWEPPPQERIMADRCHLLELTRQGPVRGCIAEEMGTATEVVAIHQGWLRSPLRQAEQLAVR
jgi:hypothetical protein